MLIRALISIFIIASSFIIVTSQAPDASKTDVGKTAKTSGSPRIEKLRDMPFPGGIDLKFLIKELAADMDLNVLFDPESFRGPRKTYIELKNVTTAAALDYILLQEGLFLEEAGPRTILVASRFRGTSIPQIGVGITPLTEQLAQYFGVDKGILINAVRENSPASKTGLKAGDVIVEIDGDPVTGALRVVQTINHKNESEVILTIVRNRKRQSISMTPNKGIGSVL